jgi:hypothetical protein
VPLHSKVARVTCLGVWLSPPPPLFLASCLLRRRSQIPDCKTRITALSR